MRDRTYKGIAFLKKPKYDSVKRYMREVTRVLLIKCIFLFNSIALFLRIIRDFISFAFIIVIVLNNIFLRSKMNT